MLASWLIAGVLLLAMVVASGRAAVVLPAQARIAIHCGSVEHCYLAAKRTGLVIWPVAGMVCYGVLGGVAASSLAASWVPGVRDVLPPAVMCVLLAFQIGALIVARRSSERAGRSRTADRGRRGGGDHDRAHRHPARP